MANFLFNVFLFSILFHLALTAPIAHDFDPVMNLERRITHVDGRGTWYEPGLGNCGWINSKDQHVLAISKHLYDGNGGSNCGQWVEIVNTSNGKTAYGYTVDSCESCTENDLDMSPALFQELESLSAGVVKISWHFLQK